MFIGHYGVAMSAGKAGSGFRLGTAILAAQFLDLLWPLFTIAGIESFSIVPGDTKLTPLRFDNYPYTHSLSGSLAIALLFGLLYYFIRKNLRLAIVYAVMVFSHWVLDFITHKTDLAVSFTSPHKLGLGLWNYPVAAIVLESIVFIAGVYIYLSGTKPLNAKGKVLPLVLTGLLGIIYVMNLAGPPPPSVNAVSYSALLLWAFVLLGYWTDKNRVAAV